MKKIPLYNNRGEILRVVTFEDNLTLPSSPPHVNEGGQIGIKRLNKGEYKDKLVFMYYDPLFPSGSHASFISEEEAYTMCLNRGKLNVVEKYDITPDYEEVI